MLASLLIHVQLAAYWCLARCPLMLSFLSALGTDRKIINTNLKSPFRKGGIETRNMRNFANYHVDVRRHTSGVVKTICEQCLPTRHNKRDRSLRVNIDTGHCHCYHCGADFYVPDDAEERAKAERQAARKRRAASAVPQHFHRPVFDASKTTLSEATERWLVETRCITQSVISGLRITEQEEFMSQSGTKERCV